MAFAHFAWESDRVSSQATHEKDLRTDHFNWTDRSGEAARLISGADRQRL